MKRLPYLIFTALVILYIDPAARALAFLYHRASVSLKPTPQPALASPAALT
ncbi:MAG TPA: hypothetical protein VD861_07550 [Pyrinomonadaceae bacterium]|nr:hypothetical protein [Pyrinomonadaceae bacterium]